VDIGSTALLQIHVCCTFVQNICNIILLPQCVLDTNCDTENDLK
jgi:hypothetical protein